MARFVVVPQWQGSPATRAMLLASGAEAIAGDLPRSACTVLDVPVEAGEPLESGIRRYSSLRRVRDELTEALRDNPAIVVGGDCGVAVAAVSDAARRHPATAVLWFDAHGGLHSAASSSSGAFGGMALRAVTGDGPLAAEHPVPPERIVLAGARSLDAAEEQFAADTGLRLVPAEADADTLVAAVRATGADAVFVHVDVDVLDPAEIAGVTDSVPFGMTVAQLTAAIAQVRAQLPLVGASLCGFAPATAQVAVDDLGALLRIVAALA
ncbi:arginase family protein [Microbacterium sp.]|uniref:arginase family protein n=1 Tax=Microbacterium sp. TaxID=51671 RepID=UPI003A835D23